MTIEEQESRMLQHKKQLQKLLADRRVATSTLRRERQALKITKRKVRDSKEAIELLQEVAQNVQQKAHSRISVMVSHCLSAVFDEPYSFRVTFERKRNKTDARITFVRKELELDPEEGAEGGVIDVAAFALRLACLLLSRPLRRRVLILDEPFRFVSKSRGYRDRVREMLVVLSEDLDVQFIIVTHMEELRVGEIVDLSQ